MPKLFFLTVSCLWLSFQTPLLAQENARNEIVLTEDRVPIHLTYYPFPKRADAAASAANAPVVVMVHGDGEDRLMWDKTYSPKVPAVRPPLPQYLNENGYAVITVDLRKHGESKIPGQETVRTADYELMLLDLAAVKGFIFQQHQAKALNMNKLGLVGSKMGAALATAFAELDWRQLPYDDSPVPATRTPRGQDVRALVLLSPEDTAGRLRAINSINFLRQPAINMSLMVVVGADDREDENQASKIFERFQSFDKDGQRSLSLSPRYKDRGIALVQRDDVYEGIKLFLDRHLKSLDSPWIDRRSRLDR